PGVVHGDDPALDTWERRRDRVREVGRERGDPALPREVVSQQRYAADRSGAFVLVHALSPRARITERIYRVATPDDTRPESKHRPECHRRQLGARAAGLPGKSIQSDKVILIDAKRDHPRFRSG
ncbi:MAG: hypothetical protein JRH14_15480, partial [Deltaproteobacteria bacterium]|nr:hypothetical protein [Deltaproteobacteria bacterium]